MSYVAFDGAWAQRVQRERTASSQFFQRIIQRRNLSINDTASQQVHSDFNSQRNMKNENNQSHLHQLSSGRGGIFDKHSEEVYYSEMGKLGNSQIGKQLLQLNESLIPDQPNLNQSQLSLTQLRKQSKFNQTVYSFGGKTNIKNSQIGAIFTNDRLNQSLHHEQQPQQRPLSTYSQSRGFVNQTAAAINRKADSQSVRTNNQSMNDRRQTLEQLAQKVRLSNALSSSRTGNRSLLIQEASKESANFHQTPNQSEPKFKFRFNEDASQEIQKQRSSLKSQRALTRRNIDHLEEKNALVAEIEKSQYSSRYSQRSNLDISINLQNSIRQQKQKKKSLKSNHSAIRSSYSKVRSKLISAIQKMEPQQLEQASERLKDIEVNIELKQEENPEEKVILDYFENQSKLNQSQEGQDETNIDEINPNIDIINPQEAYDDKTPQYNQMKGLMIKSTTVMSDKFSEIERQLHEERIQRKALESNFNKLQDLFYSKLGKEGKRLK